MLATRLLRFNNSADSTSCCLVVLTVGGTIWWKWAEIELHITFETVLFRSQSRLDINNTVTSIVDMSLCSVHNLQSAYTAFTVNPIISYN